MKVLVTGGLGYIGAHVVDQLVAEGHSITVIDRNGESPNLQFVTRRAWTIIGDLRDPLPQRCSVDWDAIIHLAADISVTESVQQPNKYWKNNLGSLFALSNLTTDHLIFASTGTAFCPANPYAFSKVAGENYITSIAAVSIDQAQKPFFCGQTIFRFFNVSGLNPGIKPTGQPTHLIRLAAMAARGEIDKLSVFGTDWDTKDGTCIRDYIHVADVAASICAAVKYGPVGTLYECLGTGNGYSVLEVAETMNRVTGVNFKLDFQPPRPGDVASMTCDSRYKHLVLNHSLDDICLSAFNNI